MRSRRGCLCRGPPGEADESVAALLLRLRDPRSGRPLPRARLWSELSVRAPGASAAAVHGVTLEGCMQRWFAREPARSAGLRERLARRQGSKHALARARRGADARPARADLLPGGHGDDRARGHLGAVPAIAAPRRGGRHRARTGRGRAAGDGRPAAPARPAARRPGRPGVPAGGH